MARKAKTRKSAVKTKPVKKSAAKIKKPVKTKTVKKPARNPVQKSKLAKVKAAKVLKTVVTLTKKLPLKKTTAKITVGSPAPDFVMSATIIGSVSRASLKGKPFVLYFYPKDDTSGCTAEACEFRNELEAFKNLGATIIGVSKDGIESHEKFSRKYNLNFPLASDEQSDVCERFGVWVQKSMYGRSYMGIERVTFVVDSGGIIRAIWRKVSVSGHAADVKKAVEALSTHRGSQAA